VLATPGLTALKDPAEARRVLLDDALAGLELVRRFEGPVVDDPAARLRCAAGRMHPSGHEDKTSFGIAIDLDTVEILKETDPDTFWQTPHYEGWPAVLIRFDSADPERVRAMIERSRDWTAAMKPPRARKKK